MWQRFCLCRSTSDPAHQKRKKKHKKRILSCVTGYTFVLQGILWSFCGAYAASQHPANMTVLKREQSTTVSLCQVADTELNSTIKTAHVWGPFTSAALVTVSNTDKDKTQLLPCPSTILTSIFHPLLQHPTSACSLPSLDIVLWQYSILFQFD